MFQFSQMYKSLCLFFIVLIGLSIFCTIPKVREAHQSYFCAVAGPVINLLNPNIYVDLDSKAPPNKNNWTMTLNVFKKKKHGSKLKSDLYREKNSPDLVLFQNPHDFVLIPTIFILALFFVTPINWKQKLVRLSLSMLILYLFLAFFISFQIESIFSQHNLALDSVWNILIWFFGLGGTNEPIYIIVFFIWALLSIPVLLKEKKFELTFA